MWGELSSVWGELSSECGASCLGASFLWGELSWGELSLGRVVRNPSIYPLQCFTTNSITKQFTLKEFMWGVSKAFSKSNMNVST